MSSFPRSWPARSLLTTHASASQLRTTPKDVAPEQGETEGMTKRQYVDAVLSTIDEVRRHISTHTLSLSLWLVSCPLTQ
jgi:hypothetical protein